MSLLNRTSHIVVYDDIQQAPSSPQRRIADWKRANTRVPVLSPKSQSFEIAPLSESVIFNGIRSLTHDNTSQYDLALVSASLPSQYRIKWTGTGTAPGFRTNRNLTLTGGTLTTVLNANQTITVTHSGGAVFGAVQVGDVVHIAGTLTYETGPSDTLNQGDWTVLSANTTTLVLAREVGSVFTGASEAVALVSNDNVVAYSATGVQVGDTIDISGGFSVSSRTAYKISTVTAKFIEFTSTVALAQELAVIPGAASLSIYSSSVRYLYIETTQNCAIKLNGQTDEGNRLEPLIPGDTEKVGFFEKWGTSFSLSVKNRSTSIANVTVFTAE